MTRQPVTARRRRALIAYGQFAAGWTYAYIASATGRLDNTDTVTRERARQLVCLGWRIVRKHCPRLYPEQHYPSSEMARSIRARRR